jgi:hypothetical protein
MIRSFDPIAAPDMIVRTILRTIYGRRVHGNSFYEVETIRIYRGLESFSGFK